MTATGVELERSEMGPGLLDFGMPVAPDMALQIDWNLCLSSEVMRVWTCRILQCSTSCTAPRRCSGHVFAQLNGAFTLTTSTNIRIGMRRIITHLASAERHKSRDIFASINQARDTMRIIAGE